MLLTVEGTDLPGATCPPYRDITVGVQRGKDPEQQLQGGVSEATWQLELVAKGEADLRGPHVQGRPGARFVYLVWEGRKDDGPVGMFRRLKIPLDATVEPLRTALQQDAGCTVRVSLTGRDGTPRCGGLRAADVSWSTDSARPAPTTGGDR